MEFDAKIRNVANLQVALNDLTGQMQRRVINVGMRAGAIVVKKKAIENVKAVVSNASTGLLARSIAVIKKKPQRNKIGYVVAIKGRAQNVQLSAKGARPGLYGSVLEFGKEGQDKRPWLRPAIATSAAESLEAVRKAGFKNLIKAVNAARAKGAL